MKKKKMRRNRLPSPKARPATDAPIVGTKPRNRGDPTEFRSTVKATGVVFCVVKADSVPLAGRAGLVCRLVEREQSETFAINNRLGLVNGGEKGSSDPHDRR